MQQYIDNHYTVSNVDNSTSTKKLTGNTSTWDDQYPEFDTTSSSTTAYDFYKYKYQKNRVSLVARAAEMLFDLPNDLQYKKGYSNFHIKNI